MTSQNSYNDIHKHEQYLDNKEQKIAEDNELSKRNKELILQYLKESKLGKTVLKGQKKTIGAGRNLQTAGILMKMSKEWFNKDLDKITMHDMEKFILDLDKGKITSKNNAPYSSETKSNIKKFIRKFYKWLLGKNRQYPELVEWIDTSKKEAEITAIKGVKDGMWSIIELIPDIRRKALLWVTFDSGMREGEIINCTIADIEKDEEGIYYIKCKHSKTTPRQVSLPLSSKLLDKWIKQHPDKNNKNASLWMTSRVMMYKTMKLYSEKALGEEYTVHQIRHTSATYWAPKLDRTTFCKRFGWSYSSKMPDRYIDFAKVPQKEVVEVAKKERISELSKELEELKQQNVILNDRMTQINRFLESSGLINEILQKAKDRKKKR